MSLSQNSDKLGQPHLNLISTCMGMSDFELFYQNHHHFLLCFHMMYLHLLNRFCSHPYEDTIEPGPAAEAGVP